MALRETENNAYAKFAVTKKSIMVCYGIFCSGVVNLGIGESLIFTYLPSSFKL